MDRARLESTLAAWTTVCHTASTFGRTKPPPVPAPGPREIRVSGAPLPAFVEPEPEAIARLVGTLRQARRGLAGLGSLAKGSPADLLLADAEDIVKIALRVAERTARDGVLAADDSTALAAIPSRMAALELDAADEGGPYVAVIPRGSRIDPRAPSARPVRSRLRSCSLARGFTRRLVLAVGAHVAHFEAVERTDQAEGAAALLERRIEDGKVPCAAAQHGPTASASLGDDARD